MRRGRIFRRSPFILAAIMMAATILFPPVLAQASFPGQDGRIAFWDFMTGQIYTVNPDGTALVQATHVSRGHQAADPAWSPDATKIAFDTDVSGDVRLWVMDANGSHPHQLTGDRPGYNDFVPTYTPDGRRVIFTRCRPDPPGGCAIYSVRTDGTHRRALTPFHSDISDFDPSVSPDGTRIAFERFGAGGIISQNDEMGADGSGAHALTPPALEGFRPDWSPDAKHIPFSSACCRLNSLIYTMNAEGTGIRRLTATAFPNNDTYSAYSPQGDQIAFVSDRRYSDLTCCDLFVMRANGTRETLVKTGMTGILRPSWGTAPLLAAQTGESAIAGFARPAGVRDTTWCSALPEALRAQEGCSTRVIGSRLRSR